jgi:hypothetical protein
MASEASITEIVVNSLESSEGQLVRLTERTAIDKALTLFTSDGWWKNQNRLVPTHRIELRSAEGEVTTYWMGTFSNPPRPPCFWFCSGFWLAASAADGALLPDKIKALATSGQMAAVGDLLWPTGRASQPNSALSPPHSVVTALAQNGKRRAAGRAG